MKKILIVLLCMFCFAQPIIAQDILNAVKKGNIDKVKELLKKDPELINSKDQWQNNLLKVALLNRDRKMAKFLIENKIDINYIRKDIGESAFHMAVYRSHGSLEIVKLMIKYGADINLKDRRGQTPLNYAVSGGNKEIVNFLLDKGADLNTEGRLFERTMRSAIAGGLERIIDKLVKTKDVNYLSKTRSGNTYLHEVAQGGMAKFVEPFIRKGMDANEKNVYGWTPLHYAASRGNTEVIDLLIKNGADKNMRAIDGQTPYNIAQEFNQQETVDFLKQKGADTGTQKFPKLKAKYVDPVLPEKTPLRFAPGIISKQQTMEHAMITFSSDLNTVCWGHWRGGTISKIFVMDKHRGVWQKPKVVQLNAIEPSISADGKKIFFVGKKKLENGENAKDDDILYIERKGSGWSDPVNLGANVNTEKDEARPSVTKDGTVYFGYNADIYRSRCINGKYMPKEKLPQPINSEKTETQPFVSLDENFLLYQTIGPRGAREINVSISYRNADDTWTNPINLSKIISIHGIFPCVTPDNNYMFFFTDDLYWVDAKILDMIKDMKYPIISLALYEIIKEKSVAEAIKQYWELKEEHPDYYDLKESMLNSLGYKLLGEKRYEEAIEIFKLNVKVYRAAPAMTYKKSCRTNERVQLVCFRLFCGF